MDWIDSVSDAIRNGAEYAVDLAKETAKDRLDDLANIGKKADEALAPRGSTILLVRRSLQLDGYSCGVQCTWTVLEHFGRELDIERLERKLGTTDEDGTDETAIRKVLKARGCSVRTLEDARLRDLRDHLDDGEPIIACVDEGAHWVVVHGHGPGVFFVCDPNPLSGVTCRIGSKEFRRKWDGSGLAVRLRRR